MKKGLLIICVGLLSVCFAQSDKRVEQHQRGGPHSRPDAHRQSGITGQVVLDSWEQVKMPVQCLITVATDSGKLVTTLATDQDGLFDVALKPGTYVLTPYWPPAPNGATVIGPSLRVTVEKKDYTVVESHSPLGQTDLSRSAGCNLKGLMNKKVFLRCRGTGHYYAWANVWSGSTSVAHEFDTVESAARLARNRGLAGIEVVVRIGDPASDQVWPVREKG